MQPTLPTKSSNNVLFRIRLWYGLLLVVSAIFVIRLFYLQIIRHDYYRKVAYSGQFKEYEVPAERGIIEAYDGDKIVPIVLNEKKYTLFADPKYIKDTRSTADKVQKIIGGDNNEYEKQMKADTRYAVLAKKLSKDQKNKLDDLKEKGIGTREESYRTYPQGQLAAQLLGFVNDQGEGKYGVEQALQDKLKGSPGLLKAITDAKGVPLVANKDNVSIEPTPGKRVVLTIDLSMQQQVEDLLKKGLDRAQSKSGSVVVMDPNTGAIKAMANYPTYNPGEFYKVEDGNVFNNASVSSPLEVGSSMKPLTAAAALDSGAVRKDQTYYDPAHFTVDDAKITNIEEDGGAGTKSIADILQLSLNTGATWLLMQMGGGQINEKARTTWYDYMTNHYHFGKATGIEQGFEADGYIPDPKKGYGLNIQYANTAFGQGMTATPLQMGAALSAAVNGGTYYRPRLVSGYEDDSDNLQPVKPDVLNPHSVKPDVSQSLQSFMEYTFAKNHTLYGMPQNPSAYNIGGKTGTAQIAKPGGGYYEDKFNGTFVGFVGGDTPQYVIVVRVNEPKIAGYAGSKAAAPIFTDIVQMIINTAPVSSKTH